MTKKQSFDLVVLGAGSGGLAAAKRAAGYGARVAIVESSRVGGTCVIRGCIPKKLMVYASHFAEQHLLAQDFGWQLNTPPEFSWETMRAGRDATVKRLETIHEGHLERTGVHLFRGHARFLDRQRVAVDDTVELTAERFIIATGAKPVMPEVEGVECCMSSDHFFELAEQPKRAVLVGGGYIACEFAGVLNSLGTQTTQIVRSRLLRTFDRDLGEGLKKAMQGEGIDVREGTQVRRVTTEADGTSAVTLVGPQGEEEVVHADTCVLFATGREPNVEGLGLETIGVKQTPSGAVWVDENEATTVPHIYAIGDVTPGPALTPVAIKRGRMLVDRLWEKSEAQISYDNIPTAVFSTPPIGTVGLTEEEARSRYGDDVQVYRSTFPPLFYAQSPAERKGFSLMKMIVQKSTDRVLGCHMLGHDAPEIVQGFAVALQAGATKAVFDRTVALHPSQAEEFVLM